MTDSEKKLAKHFGHNVKVTDYQEGDPIGKETGRFCLECMDCETIIFGNRTKVIPGKPVKKRAKSAKLW